MGTAEEWVLTHTCRSCAGPRRCKSVVYTQCDVTFWLMIEQTIKDLERGGDGLGGDEAQGSAAVCHSKQLWSQRSLLLMAISNSGFFVVCALFSMGNMTQ
jgi:hypothetical protein